MSSISALPWADLSYAAQVRALTALAEKTLPALGLSRPTLRFIQHGENTTFCVTDSRGQKYLLRLHRENYHTTPSLREELAWLRRLEGEPGLYVPAPRGSIETTRDAESGLSRRYSLLRWVEGRGRFESLQPSHYSRLGEVIARLQRSTVGRQVVHRRYWTADGLLGTEPKLGTTRLIEGVPASELRAYESARRMLLKQFRSYEKRHPERLGLVHADTHFGNVLFRRDGVGVIDFDDCGLGFHLWDLAVVLFASQEVFKKLRPARVREYTDALYEGYASGMPFRSGDEEIVTDLKHARMIAMTGWLYDRRDHPKLRKRVPFVVAKYAKMLNARYG